MVRIDLDYEGNLRTRALHEPSGTALVTDAPKDNEGEGASFSPTDLLATALGTCMMTVMGIFARRRGWELSGAHVEIEKHMQTAPERRVGRLALVFRMPEGIPEDARVLLERAAHTCPVERSLHPDVTVDARFVWGRSDA